MKARQRGREPMPALVAQVVEWWGRRHRDGVPRGHRCPWCHMVELHLGRLPSAEDEVEAARVMAAFDREAAARRRRRGRERVR